MMAGDGSNAFEEATKLGAVHAADKTDGMGFGLAIAKQVVDAHGGRIDVRRVDGETHFTLFFPTGSTDKRAPNNS